MSEKLINRLDLLIKNLLNIYFFTVGGNILSPITIGILIGTNPDVRNKAGNGFSVWGCKLEMHAYIFIKYLMIF